MSRITRIGRIRPLTTLSSAISGGGTGGGPSGQVPTANGSNSIAWGSNVATITVNGTNLVTGPFVNFADSASVTWAQSSNTLTATSTGGSGGEFPKPLMAQDPSDDHWYVVVDGDGTAVSVTG